MYEKTRKDKERIDQETKFIYVLKRKIKETKHLIEHVDTNRKHLHDKLTQLKQCSSHHLGKNAKLNKQVIVFVFRS